jgi:2-polyprenyl-3-methyl-5-hydroxy-6-metoxy-1,4-benzoquinol methylase
MANTNGTNEFDEYYYQNGCGSSYKRNETWLEFFRSIADRIIEDIHPKTVLDAGCALGFLVEGFRNRNIEAWGIDISEFAIQNVDPSIKSYCSVGSISQPFPQRYDMIVTIEVLEHLPKANAENAVANLCAHTDDIIFSSTPFDYKEATHYNVQPPEYWAELFARHGFFHDVDYDATFISSWAVRFQRKSTSLHRVVFDYERKYWVLQKENFDLRSLVNEMRSTIRSSEIEAANAVKAKEESEAKSAAFQQQQEENLVSISALQQQQEENLVSISTLYIENTSLQTANATLQTHITALQNEVSEYQARQKALEASRTWKALTRLHLMRKKFFDTFKPQKKE